MPKRTVLLVEDDQGVRRMSEKMLKRFGYEVLTAGHPEQAIQIAEQYEGPIDLMLTDVVMPAMNGRELAGHLRARRPDMKVLYMSGYTEDAIILEGIEKRGLSFLQKPFTPDELSRIISENIAVSDPAV